MAGFRMSCFVYLVPTSSIGTADIAWEPAVNALSNLPGGIHRTRQVPPAPPMLAFDRNQSLDRHPAYLTQASNSRYLETRSEWMASKSGENRHHWKKGINDNNKKRTTLWPRIPGHSVLTGKGPSTQREAVVVGHGMGSSSVIRMWFLPNGTTPSELESRKLRSSVLAEASCPIFRGIVIYIPYGPPRVF